MYNQLFQRLMTCPEFVHKIGLRWTELRKTLFATERLKSRYRVNHERIAASGVYHRRQYCPQFKTTFDNPENEIANIERWIDLKIEFLDGWFGNTPQIVKRLQAAEIRAADSTLKTINDRLKTR